MTHLKIFLRVIQIFWHGRNACDKKKVRVLLEDQCGLKHFVFSGSDRSARRQDLGSLSLPLLVLPFLGSRGNGDDPSCVAKPGTIS